MGVPTSEVGTIATTRRETTKVHKNMWWHWGEKKKTSFYFSDDCRNIATILKTLIDRGFVFEETSHLNLDKR